MPGRNHRPRRVVSRAGKTTRSPTSAAATSSESIQANRLVGANELPAKARIPRPHTRELWVSAAAECRKAACTAAIWLLAAARGLSFAAASASPRRKKVRKWSVPSTAMPRAIDAVITLPISSAAFVQPSPPNRRIMGNTLGIMATSPAPTPPTTAIIANVIKTHADRKLEKRS
jgi:hypothetical protein